VAEASPEAFFVDTFFFVFPSPPSVLSSGAILGAKGVPLGYEALRSVPAGKTFSFFFSFPFQAPFVRDVAVISAQAPVHGPRTRTWFDDSSP